MKLYERTLVPLMFLMFIGGAVVIVAGFSFDHTDFAAALPLAIGIAVTVVGSFYFLFTAAV